MTCGKLDRDQWMLVDEASRIVGTEVAGEIWKSVQGRQASGHLLLVKGVEGVSYTVMEEVGELSIR